MKKLVLMLTALLTISLSACSQSNKRENKDMKATYPNIHWKEGKLLNHASKDDLKKWVERNL